jgi:hypothetical protein
MEKLSGLDRPADFPYDDHCACRLPIAFSGDDLKYDVIFNNMVIADQSGKVYHQHQPLLIATYEFSVEQLFF